MENGCNKIDAVNPDVIPDKKSMLTKTYYKSRFIPFSRRNFTTTFLSKDCPSLPPLKVVTNGFVKFVDYMPRLEFEESELRCDQLIVNTARISYSGHNKLKNPKKDRELIDYLERHKHPSPTQFPTIVFHVKAPLFVLNQWIRHGMYMSANVESGRYTLARDEYYIPNTLRKQSKTNKQASDGILEDLDALRRFQEQCKGLPSRNLYIDLVNKGVSKELARIILQQNTMTEFFVTANLRSWLHFLDLRLRDESQLEIRDYAEVIYESLKYYFPTSIKSFTNHRLNAITISEDEIKAINNRTFELKGVSKGRKREFKNKLHRLGLIPEE